MSQYRTSILTRITITFLAATILCAPLPGCGKPPEKTPDQIEQQHQQHREYSQREVQESRGR